MQITGFYRVKKKKNQMEAEHFIQFNGDTAK